MRIKKKLKICFIGGRQAGIIAALAVLSKGNKILSAVSYSQDLTNILNTLGIFLYNSIEDKKFIKKLRACDLLLSVHGREIVKPHILNLPKLGCINVHPYLYKYKGANPVERALKDKEFKASVGVHIMSNKIDEGKVLVEEFVDVSGASSVEEIYNRLYPCYSMVTLKALEIIRRKYEKR